MRNKQELFKFLSNKVASFAYPADKEGFVTQGTTVTGNMTTHYMDAMAPYDHEEADTRLIIHLIDALKRGQEHLLGTYC